MVRETSWVKFDRLFRDLILNLCDRHECSFGLGPQFHPSPLNTVNPLFFPNFSCRFSCGVW